MAKIAKQLTELIGHTPLLELTNYEKALGLEAKIIAKLEYFNPLGSVKDRVAAAMIEQGIKDGKINQDTIIIEPTSGNTGIGLAFVAASKGLHLILIMPDTMSVERRKIVTALGAEIKLTPGREGMKGAIDEAQRLKEHYGNAFIPQQFENQANPDIHRATTAQEIWEDTDGKVDIFVSSVGTGGTCTGTGLGLRDHNPDVRIVAVEPKSSPVLSGGRPGPHKIQGIGVWTAEMILLFCMQRPNVLSFGDLAIQRGMRMVYHHRKIDRKLFEKYRRRLSPYCSVASLYFWAVAGGAIPGMKDFAPQ